MIIKINEIPLQLVLDHSVSFNNRMYYTYKPVNTRNIEINDEIINFSLLNIRGQTFMKKDMYEIKKTEGNKIYTNSENFCKGDIIETYDFSSETSVLNTYIILNVTEDYIEIDAEKYKSINTLLCVLSVRLLFIFLDK